MRIVRRTAQFKRDIKRMQRRGKSFDMFKHLTTQLADGQPLAAKYKDHVLIGQYKGSRECHVEPDWLLIYELTDGELILTRTGTHADLFE